ncbi:MAG: hypothetical protein KAQ87_01955 [Candidatus Pacebacteria bacterium]|nr:hypothetical protein [Candidatus Paceibacterota bacterium]
MQTKKTTFIIAFISAIFVSVNFMVAKAYVPLVRLPGLPTEGEINLSQYIIGLYNFLLSIVGIVAVMMLIIGGMKYITAAGNASIISDAKDTISNALFGLLLALLSWVIVSTINPDVLYIKNPGADFTEVLKDDLGACGYYDPDPAIIAPAPNCVCKDSAVAFASITSQEACQDICVNACGTTEASPCIGGTSNNPINGVCHCVDGNKEVDVDYGNAPIDAKCNEVCSNPSFAEDGKYHGVKTDLDILKLNDDNEMIPISRIDEDTFTLKTNKDYFFDFSDSYDCRGEIVSFAIEFNGGKPTIFDAPDRWCCMINNPACPSTWGELCNAGLLFKTMCDDPTCSIDLKLCTCFEPNEDRSNYPIYKVSYSSDGLKKLWTGITNRTSDGGIVRCYEDAEKLFSVRVEN